MRGLVRRAPRLACTYPGLASSRTLLTYCTAAGGSALRRSLPCHKGRHYHHAEPFDIKLREAAKRRERDKERRAALWQHGARGRAVAAGTAIHHQPRRLQERQREVREGKEVRPTSHRVGTAATSSSPSYTTGLEALLTTDRRDAYLREREEEEARQMSKFRDFRAKQIAMSQNRKAARQRERLKKQQQQQPHGRYLEVENVEEEVEPSTVDEAERAADLPSTAALLHSAGEETATTICAGASPPANADTATDAGHVAVHPSPHAAQNDDGDDGLLSSRMQQGPAPSSAEQEQDDEIRGRRIE